MLPDFTRLSLKRWTEGRRIHALFQRLEFTEFLQDIPTEILMISRHKNIIFCFLQVLKVSLQLALS